jgi:phosphoribosylanthranilate isomerase
MKGESRTAWLEEVQVIKVKICGLTNLEDALVATEAGADLLGFIFYEPSPRYVRPAAVREIVLSVKEKTQEKSNRPIFVGVFVNASPETVAHILEMCRLDAAQLHGDEPPEFLQAFPGRAYKALRPQSLPEAHLMVRTYRSFTSTSSNQPDFQPSNLPTRSANLPTRSANLPTFLLDAYHPTLYGGTGQVTDWSVAAQIARQHSVLLAGSLTPDNVAQAIEAVQPWGVDVSSGVEREKGKKDHVKIKRFVEATKTVKRTVERRIL